MDDELDALCRGNSNLEEAPGSIRPDEHHQVVELEDSDREPIRVEHVIVVDLVLSRTLQDHRIHFVNLP